MQDVRNLLQDRAPTAPFTYVVTINADHLVRLDRADTALRAIYDAAWLSLCDSRILRAGVARRGYQLSVVTGSDLAQALFSHAISAQTRVSVIGSDAATIAALRARYGLQALFHHNPPMGFIKDDAAVDEAVAFVCAHPAQYVFLCVGSPQQEILAAKIAQSGQATGVGLCVGAAIAFVAGTSKRAPLWVQRAHIEWLHRLLLEPRRLWRRYLLGAWPLLALLRRLPQAER